MPYRRVGGLLSKGERAFWNPLYHAVKGRFRIFCKVRLADIVRAPDERDERKWFRKIKGYHVDFVICEPQSTAPVLVIELDDRSHRLDGRADVDAFKDKVLNGAGIPVHRQRCQQAYDSIELRETIERLISKPRV